MSKEQQILNYMSALKISREEAEQLYADDQADYIGEEGEKMTAKAKEIRRYEKSDSEKTSRKPKERKVDKEKALILDLVRAALKEYGVKDAETYNEQKIHFTLGGDSYSITLTKHRPLKKNKEALNHEKIKT